MNKEELEKEAENIVYGTDYDTYDSDGHSDFAVIDILVKFAEPREKRIADLEAQIEKMKCCEMCKHKNLNWGFSSICEARDKIKIENPLTCKCDKWEIKEK